MINDALLAAVIEDVVEIAKSAEIVLVHGGGPEIDALLAALGLESRFVNGLRYTGKRTMEAVQMALCGKVNKELVARIQHAGGMAAGISGIDGALLRAARKTDTDLGFVGEIAGVAPALVEALLAARIIPVISPVALNGDAAASPASLNINADTAAAHIAAALGADELILMTDVADILRDTADPASLIPRTSLAGIAELRREGVISQGMIPKTDCCQVALRAGVGVARIVDGRLPHVLRAVLAGKECGTLITGDAP